MKFRWLSLSWAEAFRDGNFAVIADWFSAYYFFIGGVALLGVWAAAGVDGGFPFGLRTFVLSILFAAACAVSGWIVGLLFGIPRSLARPQPTSGNPSDASKGTSAATSPSQKQPTSRANTNLEDVSDWLTKTIVGVTLTQMHTIPSFVWHVAGRLNADGFGWVPYGQLLALSLFLFFTPGGFWLGYVGTRTMLTKILDQIDAPDQESVREAAKPENLHLNATATGIAPADPALAVADNDLLQRPLQSLTTPQEFAAWGGAQARQGNLAAAQTALEDALRTDPANQDLKQQLAKVYFAHGKRTEAEQLVRALPKTDMSVLTALYESAPGGFEKAIAIGEELIKQKSQQDNVNLHVWLACAYGQQYKYQQSNGAAATALEATRNNVVREVEKAVALSPNSKALLQSLWHPTPGADDDDLSSLPGNDPDLLRLLGQ